MASSFQQRRRDPQPLGQGWELPFLGLTAAVLVAIAAALVGLGLAGVLFGGGWVWPPTTTHGLDQAIAGIATGQPGRGLSTADGTHLPGATAVYACMAACEAVAVTAGIGLAATISRHRRPGDVRAGMASRTDAARALGVGRLRSARRLIRPDLYSARRQR